MWKSFKCKRRTGESGYMGFKMVYDNMLSFLLEEPSDHAKEYYDMIQRNRETFDKLYTLVMQKVDDLHGTITAYSEEADLCDIRLVEPRELLSLLNYIEVYNTRFLYVPRPFYRSNIFCMTTLVQMEEGSVIACLFCGKETAYNRSNDSVCFTTVAALEPRNAHLRLNTAVSAVLNMKNITTSTLGKVTFNNDPEDQVIWSQPKNIEHLHHTSCPVMWLHSNQNAVWRQKDCPFTLREVSKFHHLMQFLTIYPRPSENAVWLCLINRVSNCGTPGATHNTLDNLFKIVCHERLILSTARFRDGGQRLSTETEQWGSPTADFNSYTNDSNSYTKDVADVADLSDDASDVAGFLWTGRMEPLPSHTVAAEVAISFRATSLQHNVTTTPLDLQESDSQSQLTEENVMRAFTDGTVAYTHYYRLLYLQGFLVTLAPKTTSVRTMIRILDENAYDLCDSEEQHVCLCCNARFINGLCNFETSKSYFQPQQRIRLIKYALYGARGKYMNQHVYDRILSPVPGFEALTSKDLQEGALRDFKKRHQYDDRLKLALVWLSFSLDTMHTESCVFRIKKRVVFNSTTCCICYEEIDSGRRRTMVCGHEFCISCYNEIFMGDCCVCKRGYRTEPLTTSNSVLQGYIQRSEKYL